VHQFEKIEQFCITTGDLGESKKMHQEMLHCAEDFYKALGIAYRVVNIVSGELNDAAAIKYDLEGWFPGQAQYRELVSCSNCTDFQSRAMDVRCRAHKVDEHNASKVELSHVHMLNSTLAATGRCICCILETYQTSDGVNVPEALVPFMGGTTFMPFVRESRGDQWPAEVTKVKAPKAVAIDKPAAAMEKPVMSQSVMSPLLANGELRLDALNAKLLEYPYVDGYQPSEMDKRVFTVLHTAVVDPGQHPNVTRWLAHINSFTAAQRAAWD
jgi:hypothetical protein